MEIRKQLTADEFDAIRTDFERMNDVNIDAIRRVLVDGIQQESVAAELKLGMAELTAMIGRAWSKHVELASQPSTRESVNVTLSQDMANLIKQMARQVQEQEKNARNQCPDPGANAAHGRALDMPLADILPYSSHHPDDILKQSRLVEDVRQRGVKSPISLRPHPTMSGKWMINDGHCRFRAAQAAGLRTIPYFVDVNFDSYDQVNLNLHRDGLSPWVVADFIAHKRAEGDSKGYIAQRLGKGRGFVTEHLALVNAPACLYLAYAKGVASPRTLYDLRRAYDEFPAQVEKWCDSTDEITREAIQTLLGQLRRDIKTTAVE